MSKKSIETIDIRTRQEWREWLKHHHSSESEIWLVFYKVHTGVTGINYEDAVQEALCFGWIDSIVRRLDDDRYARKFTPRRPDSRWSSSNRRRYADLKKRGLLAAPGRERSPTSRSGDAPRPSVSVLPEYIEDRLKASPRAWEIFKQLAPSHRRAYIGWIESAKRETTRKKRLGEAVRLLAEGKKLAMK